MSDDRERENALVIRVALDLGLQVWRTGDDTRARFLAAFDALTAMEAALAQLRGERETILQEDSAIQLLALHALSEIRCDHELNRDLPICNCGTVSLGWWPTVQTAKEAWARHVLTELAALASRPDAAETDA